LHVPGARIKGSGQVRTGDEVAGPRNLWEYTVTARDRPGTVVQPVIWRPFEVARGGATGWPPEVVAGGDTQSVSFSAAHAIKQSLRGLLPPPRGACAAAGL